MELDLESLAVKSYDSSLKHAVKSRPLKGPEHKLYPYVMEARRMSEQLGRTINEIHARLSPSLARHLDVEVIPQTIRMWCNYQSYRTFGTPPPGELYFDEESKPIIREQPVKALPPAVLQVISRPPGAVQPRKTYEMVKTDKGILMALHHDSVLLEWLMSKVLTKAQLDLIMPTSKSNRPLSMHMPVRKIKPMAGPARKSRK